ncbi:MAG: class II fructose-bisphosphate aldolase [Candidatus Komeilibacteria bacterium]
MIEDLLLTVRKAQKKHYAIPAFNVSDLEMVQAIIRAAVKMKSPVIVQTSESALKYAGAKTLAMIISSVAADIGQAVPVAIHLDHGKHQAVINQCLRNGFNSVHRDASELPLAKNIAATRKTVLAARKFKARVQGELGAIFGLEGLTKLKQGFDQRQMMTDPRQVKEFVGRTGIDTLAISVGTIHGSFKGVEHIDVKLIKAIAREVTTPLVLHGGSGNDPRQIKAAIKAGVCIINVDTDLRLALVSGMRRALKKPSKAGKVDPRAILLESYAPMQAEAERLMKLFGSAGRAQLDAGRA